MELISIVSRFAEAIKAVDAAATKLHANYLPGVPSMTETQVRDAFMSWWTTNHIGDFKNESHWETELSYPENPRAKCDIVFSSASHTDTNLEWALELKCIRFIGDNGKNNDYGLSKFFSPYLKDRSLIHDIDRLSSSKIAQRKAVIGYGWNYNFDSCAEALRIHPHETERIANMRKVCQTNDPVNGVLNLSPILTMVDTWLTTNNLTKSILTKDFSGAWKHPTGGYGTIFAWEIN